MRPFALQVGMGIVVVCIALGLSLYLSAAYHEYQARELLSSYNVSSWSHVYLLPQSGQSIFFNNQTVSYFATTTANQIQLNSLHQKNPSAYNAVMAQWASNEQVIKQEEGYWLTFFGILGLYIASLYIINKVIL